MAVTSQMRILGCMAVDAHWPVAVSGLHNTFAGMAMMHYWPLGLFDFTSGLTAPAFLTIIK